MDDVSDVPQSSAYPGHAPPVPVHLVLSADHTCSYFPDRISTTRAFWAPSIPGPLYHQFMDAGFRRSGRIVYQPICAACRACVPIRVPVASFVPDKSQRRSWRKNQDLLVTVGPTEPTDEKYGLYERYRRHWHRAADETSKENFVQFLYDSPVQTIEISYRDASARLLGVGICDVSPQSLSSVYFYFEPDQARRSLGTFSALWEIEWARRNNIPYYYLGFWVGKCGAMEYKANFRPNELLGSDGIWRPAPLT
jgi:arginyl-tRNA--protein-N-Asp/Glu arginylyltransferase